MITLRFLLVLLGILPLGMLASVNLLGALRWKDPPAEVSPVDQIAQPSTASLEDRAKLADRSSKEIAEVRPIVLQFAEFDLFGREKLVDAPTVAETSPFNPSAKTWATLQKAQNLSVDLGRVFQKSGPEANRLIAVKESLKLPLLNSLSAAEPILTYLKDEEAKIKAEGDVKDKIVAAHKAYENGTFEKCLEVIAELNSATSTVKLNDVAERDLRQLGGHAKFWKHWKNLPLKTESPGSQLRKLTLLLAEDTPLPSDAKEQEFLAQQRARKDEVQSEVAVDELFASPPDELERLIDRSEQIVASNEKIGPTLCKKFRELLGSKLIEKTATKLPADILEVKLKSGGYLRGVFRELQGANPSAYKYWPNLAALNNNKGYLTKYSTEFEGRPGPSQEALLAKAFNEKLRDLKKHMDVEGKWEEFAKDCENFQQQVDAYYVERAEANALGFQDAEKRAREVHKSWSRIKPFLVD